MVRNLRGHWLDRLPAIDQDIERMEQSRRRPGAPQGDPAALKRALQAALATPVRPSVPCQHTPPAVFRPGEAVGVELGIGKVEDRERPTGIRLHFRHVNQGETFQVEDMKSHRRPVAGGHSGRLQPIAVPVAVLLRAGTHRARRGCSRPGEQSMRPAVLRGPAGEVGFRCVVLECGDSSPLCWAAKSGDESPHSKGSTTFRSQTISIEVPNPGRCI